MASWGVEIHMDRLGRILGLEEEKLGDDDVGGVVVDRAVDADDTLLEQPREDVVSSLSSRRVLNHHRNQTVASSPTSCAARRS